MIVPQGGQYFEPRGGQYFGPNKERVKGLQQRPNFRRHTVHNHGSKVWKKTAEV